MYKAIKMTVRNAGSENVWIEEYTIESDDPQGWAEGIIGNYNASLRPGERPRELVSVEVAGAVASDGKHDWGKSNAITVMSSGLMYDTYRCGKCGITGKRFGLSSEVVRDRQYKSPKYERCNGFKEAHP